MAVGIAGAAIVAISYDRLANQRDHLQDVVERASKTKAKNSSVLPTATEEAVRIEWELTVPWSELLSQLEAAGHDAEGSIALLSVEPDPSKKVVHIGAEARDLQKALEFVDRLRAAPILKNPMLESHDLNKSDPELPYRVKIIAEWRT
jgi:hypothetical protein